MGLRIFLHSINLVFRQLGDALRISGLLYVVSAVLSLAGLIFFMPVTAPGQPPSFSWQFIPLLLIITVLYLWITVGWHRFILLDEHPNGALPAFHGDRLLAYFGRLFQVGLICMVAGVVAGFVYGLIVYAAQGAMVVALAGAIVIYAVILLITYRLAPLLPGAAIGKPVNVGEAWASTSGATGTILVLAVVSAIAAVVIDLPVELLQHLPAGAILVLIWVHITAWIKLMVGISILTTLYGVYVEKRDIA